MANGRAFEAIVSIAGQIDPSLQRSIEQAQKSYSGLGKSIKVAGAIGVAGIAAIGTATVTLATKATQAAADYEECFAQTSTLLSGTQEELDAYSKSILEVSDNTGIAAAELTETVYNAISAGIDQENAVEFAGQAAKLAAGGFTDSATAVDVMTTALNAYGLEAEKAGDISDYLIVTQNLGKTTVDELASSVGKVIPIASAYGVEMDNLSTAYAQLTAGGIATAEAGTYLKAMLNELGDSGSVVSGVLKDQTGMSFAELTKSGKSLGDVMSILGDSVDGNAGAFNELWSSSEAGVGALSLMNGGAEAYNATLKEMRESTGITDDAYQTMTNTLKHQVEVIKNLGQNFLITTGQEILPTVTEVAKDAIPLISTALEKTSDVVSKVMPLLKSGIETVIPVIEELANNALPKIDTAMNAIIPIIQQVIPIILDVLSVVMDVTAKINGEMSEVVKELTPIWTSTFSEIAEIIQKVIPIITSVITQVIEILQSIIPIIISIVAEIGGALQGIIPILTPIITQIGEMLQVIIQSISPFLKVVLEKIQPIIKMLLKNLIPVIQMIAEVITDIIPVILEVFNTIMPIITQISAVVINLIGTILSAVIPAVQQIMLALQPLITTCIQIIEQILPCIQSRLNILTPILSFVANIIGTVLGNAIKIAASLLTGLINTVSNVLGAFSGMLDFFKTFVGTWHDIWNTVSNAVSGAFTGLVGTVKGPINTIIGMVNSVIDNINGVGFEIPDWVPGVGGKAFELSVPKLPMLETGGLTQGPSIAGEAGQEMVISFSPKYRDANIGYWKQAGDMLGIDTSQKILTAEQDYNPIWKSIDDTLKNVLNKIGISKKENDIVVQIDAKYQNESVFTSPINTDYENELSLSAKTGKNLADNESYASILETGTITNNAEYKIESVQFNPTIIIQGNADKKDIDEAIKESKEDFFDKLDEWWNDKMGGGDYEPEFQ